MGPNLPAARQEYMEALIASLVDGEVLSDCTSDHLKQLLVNLMKGLEQKYRHVGEAMLQTRGCLDNLQTLYLEAEEEALAQFHARIQSATTSGHAVDAHVHRRAIQSCYTDLVRNIDIKNTTLSDEFVAQGFIDAADADSLTGIKSTKAANEAFLKRVCIMFAFEQFMDTFLPTLTPYVPESIEKKLRDLTDPEVSRSGSVVDRCAVCQVKAYVNPREIADKLLEMTAILPNLHTDLKNQTLSSESRWARIIDVVKQPGQIVEALRNILPCPVFQEFDLERVDAFVCRCPTSGEESGMAEFVEMEAAEQTVPKSQLGERDSGTDNEDCHAHRIGVQRVHRLLVTSLQGKGPELFKKLVEINALKDCDVASLAAMSNGKMQAEATLRIVQNTLSFGQFVENFLPVISTSCPESVYGDLLTSVWVSRAKPHPSTCSVCQTKDRIDPKRLADIFLETGYITVNVHSDLKTSGLGKEHKWDIICKKVPDDVILAALKEQYPGFFQDAHLADVTMFDCHCDNATLSDTVTDIACMDDVESVDGASLTESPEEMGVDMKTQATRLRSDQHDTRIQEIFQLHCNKSSGKTETDGTHVPASRGQDDNRNKRTSSDASCGQDDKHNKRTSSDASRGQDDKHNKRTSSDASRGQDDKRNKRTSSDKKTTFYSRTNRSTGTDRKAAVTSIDDLDLYVYYDRNGFFTRFYKYLKDKWARLAGAGREQPRLFDFDAYILYSEERLDFVMKILGCDELSDFRFCDVEQNGLDHPLNKATGKAGEECLKGFMQRHPDLSIRKPEATSISRAVAFDRLSVNIFFNLLKAEMEKHLFQPDSIWNMDESGSAVTDEPEPETQLARTALPRDNPGSGPRATSDAILPPDKPDSEPSTSDAALPPDKPDSEPGTSDAVLQPDMQDSGPGTSDAVLPPDKRDSGHGTSDAVLPPDKPDSGPGTSDAVLPPDKPDSGPGTSDAVLPPDKPDSGPGTSDAVLPPDKPDSGPGTSDAVLPPDKPDSGPGTSDAVLPPDKSDAEPGTSDAVLPSDKPDSGPGTSDAVLPTDKPDSGPGTSDAVLPPDKSDAEPGTSDAVLPPDKSDAEPGTSDAVLPPDKPDSGPGTSDAVLPPDKSDAEPGTSDAVLPPDKPGLHASTLTELSAGPSDEPQQDVRGQIEALSPLPVKRKIRSRKRTSDSSMVVTSSSFKKMMRRKDRRDQRKTAARQTRKLLMSRRYGTVCTERVVHRATYRGLASVH
ncbi:uncharacterized protein [Haliotis cracherodii]|uniref:uncharacterized protein n=1 Tax=Haliotis cracherodii TaxID=6455 RepID=UPI0039EB9CF1